MKKSILRSCILAFILLANSFSLFANDITQHHPFELSPVNDGFIIGAGTVLTGSSIFVDKFTDFKDKDYDASKINKADVPVMDQLFMQSYNKPLHYISYGTMGLVLAAPAVFATVPDTEWLTIGVMYCESLMWSYGIKEWGKLIINRTRPYMYYDDYPQAKVDDGDWNCSMPSGHTTAAFTSAAFTSYVFNQYYPDSKLRYVVTGVSFGLAATTGILRMASGNHFYSDVLAGAVIGCISGFVVPYMHTEFYYSKFRKDDKSLTVSPMGLSFEKKF